MKTASYWIFIITLIFCPLAFGSVEPWSQAIMQFLVPLGLCCFLFSGYSRDHWRTVPGLLPLLGILLFIGLQLIPLPIALLKIISPASLAIYQPLIDLPNGPTFLPITINIKSTVNELCRLTTYACFYILTIQLTASYTRLRRTIFIIVTLAGVIAFFAIIQKFTSPDKIFWFRQAPLTANPVGPWIYRNHYAGFMEMIIPFGLALFLQYRPQFSYKLPLREKIISALTLPTANRHILFGFATFIMASSVIISLSRGGIISTALSFLCFILLLNRNKQLERRKLPIIICLVMIFLLTFWLGWEPVINRFNQMTNAENDFFNDRFLIWQDTLPLIKDYWLAGAGFGTFIYIFPLYREMLSPGLIIDHAHNDYLELLANGGIIGAFLILWFLGTILSQAIKQLQQRRDNNAKLLGIAAICSILSIAFHSVTDFNMHNGANGLYFFFTCGLLISATHTKKRSKQATFLKTVPAPKLRLGIPVICLGLGLIILNQGRAQAYQHYVTIKDIYLNRNIPEPVITDLSLKMKEACKKDPLTATYPFALANIHTFLKTPAETAHYYQKALLRNPTNPSYLLQAGYYLGQNDPTIEYELLKAAARADRTSSWVNRNLAAWYLEQGDKEQGFHYLQTALSFEENPNNFSQYVAIALTNKISLLELEDILPKQTKTFMQMGSFLAKEQDIESATFYYKEGMRYLSQDDVQPWYFTSPFRFFWQQKQYDNAMSIARTAVEYMPENVSVLLMAGDIYLQQEIPYKAKEYYQQALMVEPGNGRAERGLKRLDKGR
ncbi:MAG: O-antigen ligase family protein [Desulfobulbaceae bacterium]|jgi:O-antigen ligase|nr:O-antigen ligase family protein [Desulfobulbaceae bacterium]